MDQKKCRKIGKKIGKELDGKCGERVGKEVGKKLWKKFLTEILETPRLQFAADASKYEKFITYAFASSDSFSLSHNPKVLKGLSDEECAEYLSVMEALLPYRIAEKKDKSDPKYTKSIAGVYRCCDDTKAILLSQNSVADWSFYRNCPLPQNLMFYRKEKTWFESIADMHSEYLIEPTVADILFFRDAGIVIQEERFCIDNQEEWLVRWEQNDDDGFDFVSIVDYHAFIHYACDTCSSFSLNDNQEFFMDLDDEEQKKYRDMMYQLEPYLLYKRYIRDGWAPATGTSYRDTEICYYRCCPETEEILTQKESVFDWSQELGMPEELCFYREEKIWYSCITHEDQDSLHNFTEEDLAYLSANAIINPDALIEDYREDEWVEIVDGGFVNKSDLEEAGVTIDDIKDLLK